MVGKIDKFGLHLSWPKQNKETKLLFKFNDYWYHAQNSQKTTV